MMLKLLGYFWRDPTLKKKNILGSVLLFLCAFFWGSTFVAQSSAADSIGAFTFLAARSVVGATALWLLIGLRVLFVCRTGKEHKASAALSKRTLLGGLSCGVAITAASLLQQYGIQFGVSSGEAGFITSLYMFIVPLLTLFLYKQHPRRNVLFGALLTLVGLYFLCILGAGGKITLGVGHFLVFGCAILFAIHMLVVECFSDTDGLYLSAIQFSVVALLSILGALLFEDHTFGELFDAWFPIVYAGVFSTAIGYTLQIFGQKYTPTAVAPIIMSLESVIAFLCEWLCAFLGIFGGHVEMNVFKMIGCLLAFVGIVLAQMNGKNNENKEKGL